MKTLAALLLALTLMSGSAKAAASTAVAPVVYAGSEAFWPFALATVGGFAVVYLNAEAVPFPLCGYQGLTCSYTYPADKNGG